MMSARPRSRFKNLAVLLGVLAVLIRCVIPPGVMPDLAAAAKGEFKLVICTSGGAMSLDAGHGSHPQPGRHHGGGGDLCPYAAAGYVATIADPIVLAAPSPPAEYDAPPYRSALHRPIRHTLGARAPPPLFS